MTDTEAWSFILTANSGSGGLVRPAAEALSPEAATLLDIFEPLLLARGPLAKGQLGQSLDGRIATESGASHYINGEAARLHLHRLRAIVDAVLIGVGTLNADDPQLTVRHVEGPDPLRVIVDPEGRANPQSRVFHDGRAPVLHVRRAGSGGTDAPPGPGVETLFLPGDADFGLHPVSLLEALAARGLARVLVEGGGLTVSRFLRAGALQRLHLMVAPMLIGSGRPGICLPPIHALDAALRPACRVFACGEDSLFDLALGNSAGPR
ncbi:MAG: RibD family protein [Gammaproteobacteria bacterium]